MQFTNLGAAGYQKPFDLDNQAKSNAVYNAKGGQTMTDMQSVQAQRAGRASGNFPEAQYQSFADATNTTSSLADRSALEQSNTPQPSQAAKSPLAVVPVTAPVNQSSQSATSQSPATSATNNTSPLATSPAKVGQTNFGTGNTYQAPQLDANGRYIAPVAAAASTPLAQPMQPAYQQAPIQSNVLPDRQANEKMQNIIASNNALQQQDMTIGANRINAKYAHQQNQDLMNFDINGHQKPQLEQQTEGQKDLSQRRSENQKGWEALLGNDLANKKLTQVDAAQAYQNEQFNQTKAQQESQYARTMAAAPKTPAYDLKTVDTYNEDGAKNGQRDVVFNKFTGQKVDDATQQRKQSAAQSKLNDISAALEKDPSNKALLKQQSEYKTALGIK